MRTLSRAHVASNEHGIDLAPMLDFVVNLLIFFIITAVFVKQAGIELNRPTGTSDDKGTPKSFVIDGRGDVWIDGKTIDLRAVRAHVERLKAAEARVGIVVVADRHAPMGVVVAVADQVRLARVADITFTTETLAKQQQ